MNSHKPRFLRSDTVRHLRLGKKRRTLQKWRRARGRHSKIRRKRAGYPVSPSIGYGSPCSLSGRIKGKKPVVVETMKDLARLEEFNIAIISRRVGSRKRLELIKIAREKGIQLLNLSGGVSP